MLRFVETCGISQTFHISISRTTALLCLSCLRCGQISLLQKIEERDSGKRQRISKHLPGSGFQELLEVLWLVSSRSARMSSSSAAMAAELPCYTLVHLPGNMEVPNETQLKADLEKGDNRVKADALRKVLYLILNGERIPGILMTIIRFVLPSQVRRVCQR